MMKEISPCLGAPGICTIAAIGFVLPVWLAVYLLPSGSIENPAKSRAQTVAEVIDLFKRNEFDPEVSLAAG